ncbi:MAG: hypothetical protein EHM70_01960, partial [Chloroflexota bacterium]
MKRKGLLFVLMASFLFSACGLVQSQPGKVETPSDVQPVSEVSQLPSPTTAPTDTAVPTDTPEPTATATATSTSTATPTATNTPEPTATSTITPTPGPIVFTDDFSEDKGYWEECNVCEWKHEALYVGPYQPSDTTEAYVTYYKECGTPEFYKMSVDVTYIEGPTDRGYGIVIRDTGDYMIEFLISTWQITWVSKYDYHLEAWDMLNNTASQIFSGLINPGNSTNRIGVEVRPSGNGQSDYFIRINNKTYYVLYGQPTEAGRVGISI